MSNPMKELYDTIITRKDAHAEGSYTNNLFEKGLDKILKKCGEECSEVIIAAKSLIGGYVKREHSNLALY